MIDLDKLDPSGLFQDVYVMEGITAGDCRSVFLDWALSQPAGSDQAAALKALHDHYGLREPDHPMSAVLRDAVQGDPTQPRRRGGAAARSRPG